MLYYLFVETLYLVFTQYLSNSFGNLLRVWCESWSWTNTCWNSPELRMCDDRLTLQYFRITRITTSSTSHTSRVARPLHLWLWKWKVQSWMNDFPQNTLRILASSYCCNVERTSHPQQPVALTVLNDCMYSRDMKDTISCDWLRQSASQKQLGRAWNSRLHQFAQVGAGSSEFCLVLQPRWMVNLRGEDAWSLGNLCSGNLDVVFFSPVKWSARNSTLEL